MDGVLMLIYNSRDLTLNFQIRYSPSVSSLSASEDGIHRYANHDLMWKSGLMSVSSLRNYKVLKRKFHAPNRNYGFAFAYTVDSYVLFRWVERLLSISTTESDSSALRRVLGNISETTEAFYHDAWLERQKHQPLPKTRNHANTRKNVAAALRDMSSESSSAIRAGAAVTTQVGELNAESSELLERLGFTDDHLRIADRKHVLRSIVSAFKSRKHARRHSSGSLKSGSKLPLQKLRRTTKLFSATKNDLGSNDLVVAEQSNIANTRAARCAKQAATDAISIAMRVAIESVALAETYRLLRSYSATASRVAHRAAEAASIHARIADSFVSATLDANEEVISVLMKRNGMNRKMSLRHFASMRTLNRSAAAASSTRSDIDISWLITRLRNRGWQDETLETSEDLTDLIRRIKSSTDSEAAMSAIRSELKNITVVPADIRSDGGSCFSDERKSNREHPLFRAVRRNSFGIRLGDLSDEIGGDHPTSSPQMLVRHFTSAALSNLYLPSEDSEADMPQHFVGDIVAIVDDGIEESPAVDDESIERIGVIVQRPANLSFPELDTTEVKNECHVAVQLIGSGQVVVVRSSHLKIRNDVTSSPDDVEVSDANVALHRTIKTHTDMLVHANVGISIVRSIFGTPSETVEAMLGNFVHQNPEISGKSAGESKSNIVSRPRSDSCSSKELIAGVTRSASLMLQAKSRIFSRERSNADHWGKAFEGDTFTFSENIWNVDNDDDDAKSTTADDGVVELCSSKTDDCGNDDNRRNKNESDPAREINKLSAEIFKLSDEERAAIHREMKTKLAHLRRNIYSDSDDDDDHESDAEWTESDYESDGYASIDASEKGVAGSFIFS
eukprot:g1170.t1